MRKIAIASLILLLSVFYLNAQVPPVLILGDYNATPFISFINEIEQNSKVKFFFDIKDIDSLTVTATFNNTPLADCLEIILLNTPLKFTISDNQVVIYPGFYLSGLFPGSEETGQVTAEVASPAKKLSKEKLLQLQYQIINIGTPGKSKSKTAVISGHLRNFETGEPIVGGNVYVPETQKGATSDAKGFYKLQLPVGNQTLNISCIGLVSTTRNINLYSDGKLDVDMEIMVNILEGAEVVAHGKGNLGQAIGMVRIDPLVIKSIPTLLGEADIMKSVLIMPGVQSVGEGTSGFNVRGGNTDQNLILIDQAPIYYPSHFFGNFSAINSEIISDATLYKGSMPIKYGGRISSVFEINTIEGNHDKISGSTGISPISARANISGPLSDKSTFVVSFRSTYSNWLLGQFKVAELYKSKANFDDIHVKLNLFINDKNSLLVSFYNSNDKFQLHSDTAYSYKNLIGSLILKHNFNPKLKLSTALISSLFNYNISNNGTTNESFILTHNLADLSFNNDFEYFTNSKMKYLFGADFNFYSVNPGERKALNNSNITPINSYNEHALEFAVYAGTEYDVSDKFKIEGGLRLSGLFSFNRQQEYIYAASMPYQVENIIDTLFNSGNSIGKVYMNPEWRFSLNYSINYFSSLKFSYNKTAQYIHMLSNTTAISPTDTWKLSDKLLLPETGNQISAGYFRSFNRNRIDFSVETYYKLVNNVKEYKAGADLLLNDHIETEIVNGKAKSYGFEFRVEKSGGRVYGQIDYTYSRTFIKSVSEFPEEQINNGEYFPANYDKPHNLNLLANLKASRRFIISTNLTYSTGRPITYPVAQYKLGNQIFLQYSKYNQYRIPDYFRTDLSLTLNGNLKKYQRTHSSVTFSVYNLTARKNAYSVYFISEGGKFDAYKLSIFGTVIPTLTYNLTF